MFKSMFRSIKRGGSFILGFAIGFVVSSPILLFIIGWKLII